MLLCSSFETFFPANDFDFQWTKGKQLSTKNCSGHWIWFIGHWIVSAFVGIDLFQFRVLHVRVLHCYRSSNPRGLSIRFNGWLVIAVSTAGRAIAMLAQFRVLAANAHGIGNMGHPPPCQPSTQPRASTSHQNQHLIMHHRIAEQHQALLNKARLTGLPL